jgi:hypothetical protein
MFLELVENEFYSEEISFIPLNQRSNLLNQFVLHKIV